MAECELKVLGNPVPLAKIKLDDGRGCVRWARIPIDEPGGMLSGKVKVEGKNSKLIYDSGSNAGKEHGTLINFTLYHYNKAITYTLLKNGKPFRCKVEDNDFEMDF